MRNYHNIDPTRNVYTGIMEYRGYANGVWRIKRYARGNMRWRAINYQSLVPMPFIYGRTLQEISVKLDKIANGN